ncbi:TPA: phosphoribosylformylglycinamidine synthase, partial [Candidatus Sumerlaeota bacterium]|nr:phosphoribosylformylglycinamidine synthase [Candidatus Sumerlaeota bacterium]
MLPFLLQGVPALSQFRADAILEKASDAQITPAVTRIDAHYVYLIEADAAPTGEPLDKTLALLGATGPMGLTGGFFVTPRKGTLSPWSSKATDIFHNCNMGDDIKRVERGIYYRLYTGETLLSLDEAKPYFHLLHDRMTEGVYDDISDIFHHQEPAPLCEIDILKGGKEALERANVEMGLAISGEEIDYLYKTFSDLKRNPTDVELLMFGQVNSEHCRHKIFNADWIIDGEKKENTLFGMIRNTHKLNPGKTLSAYSDNSAVFEGFPADKFEVNQTDGKHTYQYVSDQMDILCKVETHNHPTAISPFPGAATGVGGEIRDEAATGIGGKSKAGLAGFMVSNLRIPHHIQPWEKEYAEFPDRLATPLEIMIDGPLGGAAFGNEFGRPQLCGFFKTYDEEHNGKYRGFHKPIMLAGGLGGIKRKHVQKNEIKPGAKILQIGGPALRIGIGGGAASSMSAGSNALDLDFNSVQRDNAEMQRRCQEVVDACIALGDANPIISIHDIGAGGLSNGCPELVAETGGEFWLRNIHNQEGSMSPMEIWCCEAQERYVLGVSPEKLDGFLALCERERCPVAVLGQANDDNRLILKDEHFDNNPIDIDINV